jgi:TusA-related sulfurtransferase
VADIVVDAKGLKCPIPIVRLSTAVKKLTCGQIVEVRATDPAFIEDVKAWCNMTGHALEDLRRSKDEITAVIKIKMSKKR